MLLLIERNMLKNRCRILHPLHCFSILFSMSFLNNIHTFILEKPNSVHPPVIWADHHYKHLLCSINQRIKYHAIVSSTYKYWGMVHITALMVALQPGQLNIRYRQDSRVLQLSIHIGLVLHFAPTAKIQCRLLQSFESLCCNKNTCSYPAYACLPLSQPLGSGPSRGRAVGGAALSFCVHQAAVVGRELQRNGVEGD